MTVVLGRLIVKAMLNNKISPERIFRALADPTRMAIVEQLIRNDTSVSELAEPLAMSLAAVVQHVNILEESGVIRTQKIGRVRTCRIEQEALAVAEKWIAQRRGIWERRLDQLGALLAKQAPTTKKRRRKS